MADHLVYQMNEGEYVTADEYPELTADPSGFFLHKYLPRVFGALEPLHKLPARNTVCTANLERTTSSCGHLKFEPS